MGKTTRRSRAAVGTLLPATPIRSQANRLFPLPASATRLDQIRKVGCRLLFRYGYSGMTMREIAASLRIKAASLYYHFPSKQDILFDLMRATASELLEGLRKIVEAEPEPGAQLEAAIRWHVLFHTQKQVEAFVSHSELRSLEPKNLQNILKLRREYERLFDAILERGQHQGVFRVEDVSVIRNCILTMCTATAGWFSPQGRFTAEQVAEKVRDFVWAATVSREPHYPSNPHTAY